MQSNVEQWLTPEQARRDVAALDAAGYESLALVLRRAFIQASHGKGAERHGQALPFDQQPMQRLIDLYGPGFAFGQAAKKMQEAMRLPHERAVAEVLGAIVYAAGGIIAMERDQQPAVPVAANDNVPQSVGMRRSECVASAHGSCINWPPCAGNCKNG